MFMDIPHLGMKKVKNTAAAAVLILVMAGLTTLLAFLMFGRTALIIAPAAFAALVAAGQAVEPARLLRAQGAQRLTRATAPALVSMVRDLSVRAELPVHPELYYLPSPLPNALSLGNRRSPIVAVTRGILERLTEQELAAALAHEIAHIKNNDISLLTLAARMNRIVSALSSAGQILLFMYLPVFLFTGAVIPLPAIALLIATPVMSFALQLALGRTREFAADLTAADLTGDPESLARALLKLERGPFGLWDMLFPKREERRGNRVFSTHPATEERVRRLRKLRHRGENIVLKSRKFF